MIETRVVCDVSALPLHVFIRDFIRSVYLGQVIYNIEASISQATKSAFFVYDDDDDTDLSEASTVCVYYSGCSLDCCKL